MKHNNHIGEKYGRLTILSEAPPEFYTSGRKKKMVNCKCECGNYCTVGLESILQGSTKSCGCLLKEVSRKHCKALASQYNVKGKNKKYNTYDLSGEFGIGYTSKGEIFYFDKEDYQKIQPHCWYKDSTGYLASNSISENRTPIRMHRYILPNIEKAQTVDHINHNRLDNRKNNLRLCSYQENSFNKKTKGYHITPCGTYCTQIRVGDIRLTKTFKTEEEAIEQRKLWVEKYHKDFQYTEEVVE